MTGYRLDRRQALIGGISILLLSTSARAGGSAPFTQGVASGDPASGGFVIWTRLAPDPLAADGLGGMPAAATVKWTVFADEALLRPVAHGTVTTSPTSAHTVHVEVDGLRPDHFYWYRFEALGRQSPVGKARTLPLETAHPKALKLAYASCSHYEMGYFSAYRHMADETPDYILFLGDYIYESSQKDVSKTVRRHEQAADVRTLAQFRNRYALYRTDADLQILHASATALMTWDDHEVQNDYSGFVSQYMNDDVNLPAIRAAAYQAFYDFMPLRRSSRLIGSHVNLYKGYRFGRLAEINMLDGRQYRSPLACAVGDARKGHVAPDSCTERTDPGRSLLGFTQEAWLYDRFAKSQATWNVMGQDLLVATFRQKGMDAAGQAITGHWTDTWDGYPATRDRLLAAMQHTRLKNPVMLGGDIHSYWATELKADARSATIAVEFVGTSITSDPAPPGPFVDMLPENPHIKYYNAGTHGYGVVDIGPDRMEVRFRAISDRRDPQATITTETAFVVENGRPEVNSMPS